MAFTLPPTCKAKTKNSNIRSSVERSPFFHPSGTHIPKEQPRTTPRGTKLEVHTQKQQILDDEHKTGVLGTSANLVVTIIGAGIVGIPYAIKKSGLVAGIFMTILSAVACDKSLRLLIETAKHVDVTSYETLFEAAFGSKGFKTMCGIMFAISYGATISYMMIIKDMLSLLFGIDEADEPMRRAVMVIATLLVVLPLSSQRDMADLAKTSRLSVIFYLCIVLFVVICSPIASSIQSNGGWENTVTQSMIRPDTFFAGFGVLTFAFVCQHSAFIMAGSLERPNKQRWAKVTHLSLAFSGALAIICGVAGYLAFLDKTNGNILMNMESLQNPLMTQLNKIAQGMLLTCMFFVYPLEAFVLRHVSMVLFFKGRAAHDGFDHLVLARPDRRLLLTFGVYMLTLLPALLLQNLGSVLSITGSVAGSALSYICPGLSFLSVHGAEFKKLVNGSWVLGNPGRENAAATEFTCRTHILTFILGRGAWYLCFMPVWMTIAEYGQRNLLDYAEKEALKSPAPLKPLGKIAHKHCLSDRAMGLHTPDFSEMKKGTLEAAKTEKSPLLQMDLEAHQLMPKKVCDIPKSIDLSAERGLNNIETQRKTADCHLKVVHLTVVHSGYASHAVGAAIVDANDGADVCHDSIEEEDDPQSTFPKLYDFFLAIFFISFGAVAMIAGLYSVLAVSLL
jgi:sodium-coupled neutral amino acid transporter 11